MRAIFLTTIAFLVGCVAPQAVNIKTVRPDIGTERTVYTGDVLFESINCYGQDNGFGIVFNGDCIKFDLTVVGVSKDKITLQYREYMKPVAGKYGGYRVKDPWLVKEGFTRNLEYSPDDGYLRYKGYSFKILSTTGSSITYVTE